MSRAERVLIPEYVSEKRHGECEASRIRLADSNEKSSVVTVKIGKSDTDLAGSSESYCRINLEP